MPPLQHQSAKPSHYNRDAKHYDTFNEKASECTNQTLQNILEKHRVKTVLDLTCGTGSQVFWLAKHGYTVVGSDINTKMLKIARSKAKREKIAINFLKGDMRTLQVGKFDAVITIFNAVGHLTKLDFESTMRNIHKNLNPRGLYIFDIFNLNYLAHGSNITKLTIDWLEIAGDAKARTIQYSTIDGAGILASYTTSYTQEKSKAPKMTKSAQTLQVYTAVELREMLQRNGFSVIRQCGLDGSRLIENKTERILTVAKRVE